MVDTRSVVEMRKELGLLAHTALKEIEREVRAAEVAAKEATKLAAQAREKMRFYKAAAAACEIGATP